MNREVNSQSKHVQKHQLTSLVLCDMMGPLQEWSNIMTFANLNSFLLKKERERIATLD
jgi:hypothetical protein